MRRLALLVVAVMLSASASPAAARTDAARSWASPQIARVVEAGLMAPSTADFRPEDELTWAELARVVTSLGGSTPTRDPAQAVTMRELDAQLVALAGLRREARNLRLAALTAGLRPKPWLGTETVARMLGFRINHLRNVEGRERQLLQAATRAEAAYSLARYLTLTQSELEAVRASVAGFAFPSLSDWQRAVLERALRFVGSPYVWAGTSERPQELFGKVLPGGFDCSGFAWRVYKLEPFPGVPALAAVLQGRSSYDMSGEVPRSARLTRAQLRPADLAFFGTRGPRSRPDEVGHMGIYLGNGWIAHSSRFGTTLVPMTGWYDTTFAWGRSPLVEAGLEY